MLHELQRICDKDETAVSDDLRKVAEVLLERQFLYADKRRDKGVYNQVLQFQAYYENLFDALNMDLVCNVTMGYLGIIPRGPHLAVNLDTDHTLMLLVLRVIYENSMLECRAIEGGHVLIDNHRLSAFYKQHTGQDLHGFAKTKEILTSFARRGIADFKATDDKELTITIRPAIRDLVSSGWLEALEDYLETDPAGLGAEEDLCGRVSEGGEDEGLN